MRKAGYKPNNALRDQRTALLWIQKYISGFGGDSTNVTLIGESAGGVSVSYHLYSKEPLFRRCMLMSGSNLLMPPAPLSLAESNYKTAMKALGLESASPAETIQALNSMDGKKLCEKMLFGGIPMLPVVDDDIITAAPKYSNLSLQPPFWCEAVIIGDCQFDGNIQSLRLGSKKAGIAKVFRSSITTSLGESLSSKLLQAYSLSPELPDNEAFFRVLEFVTDVQFYSPTTTYAETLAEKMKVYMYRFNEPNPWEGPWKGHAIHIQDLMWLFQNLNEFMDGPQQAQAKAFAGGVLDFANGQDAWRPWKSEDRVAMVMGPKGKVEMTKDEPSMNGRRAIVHELAKEAGGMDVLSDALNAFTRAPPPS